MRIIKSNDHGILLVPFDIKGCPHLAVTMILGFDLVNPSQSVSEQKLWQWINDSLQGQVFDSGMPKLNAEWLVSGHAYSGNAPRQQVRVSVSLAGKEKTLDVYGERHWMSVKDKLVPSKPKLFSKMPLRWEVTWGGEAVLENTLGVSQILENAPLPNIVYANEEVAENLSLKKMTPVSFLPLAIEHPVRKACLGTYDDVWFREQWPHFPNDFNWLFFNQSPQDQWHSAYFQGGEFYSLINLHPEHESITGHLPYYQPRAFIRQQVNHKVHQYPNNEAEQVSSDIEYKVSEVLLRNDTVWFFPDNQLGIRLFRGSIPIVDEEALDVSDVLLVTEEVDSQPKTIEHYAQYIRTYQISKEYEPESVTMAKEQMQLMLSELAQAKKNLSDLPRYFEFKQAQLTDNIPSPSMTPSTLFQSVPAKLDGNIVKLEKLKGTLSSLPVPKSAFTEIENSINKIKASKTQFSEFEQSYKAVNQQIIKQARAIPIPPIPMSESPDIKKQYAEGLKKVEMAINTLESNSSKQPWHDKASQIIGLAQLNLTNYIPILKGYGFRQVAIKKHMLVYINEPQFFSGKEWGLDDIKDICIPKGWLLAEYSNGLFTALHSREQLFDSTNNIIIEGSEPELWYSELVVGQPVLLCQDKVIAWLLEQDLQPYANIIELSSPTDNLSDEAKEAVKAASQVFIFTQGVENTEEWEVVFPKGEWLSLQNDLVIQNAYKEGIDLVDWFLPYLKQNDKTIALNSLTASQKAKRQAKSYLPAINVENMVNEQYQSSLSNMGIKPGQTIAQAMADKFAESKEKVLSDFASPSAKKTLQEKVQLSLSHSKPMPLSEAMKQASSKLDDVVQSSRRHIDDPVTLENIKKGGGQLQSGMGELMDFVKQSEAKMDAANMSPENAVLPLSPLTREDVIQYKMVNKDMIEKDLSGLDLSGLDLSGVDFSKSIMSDTDLSETILTDAKFNHIIGDGLILNDAQAQGASFDKAMLVDASFKHADLSKTQFVSAMATGANFTGSVMMQARLHQISAIGADFSDCCFNGSDLSKGIFLNAIFENAQLKDIDGTKMKAFQASARKSQWQGARLTKALFWEAELDMANFSSIHAENARFAKAKLNYADFNGAYLMKSNFSEAELYQANLSESDLRSACFNQVLAREANFEAVNLKKTQCIRSDFTLVNFNGSDAMEANFMRSLLTSAQLEYVNLYNADLYKVTLGNNSMTGSNFKRTLLAQKEAYIDE
ncbi:DUF2169 domain-containing protein [uncultured Shewanella sp.]|uniref:DUF2169 family type VI secretion system accessory protein n=1 Tax=uncultured Shewanella sp. TaxID=173975 RepID=UPI0026204676|nr:DUF2169 domain-containing protein [uncultured Shewanella sp.]